MRLTSNSAVADHGKRVWGRTTSPFSGNMIWKKNHTLNAHLKVSFPIYILHTIVIYITLKIAHLQNFVQRTRIYEILMKMKKKTYRYLLEVKFNQHPVFISLSIHVKKKIHKLKQFRLKQWHKITCTGFFFSIS